MLAMAAKKASSSQETKWGECNITTILIVVSWCPHVLRRGLGVRPSQCKKRVRPPCLKCICTNGRVREWCKWSKGQLVLFFFIYWLPCVRLDVSEFWRVRILNTRMSHPPALQKRGSILSFSCCLRQVLTAALQQDLILFASSEIIKKIK